MENTTRVISCLGDSVTEGMSVNPNQTDERRKGLPYPAILQQLLGDGYTVYNAGDGGERTHAIMSRQGALRVYTKDEYRFDVSETVLLIDKGKGRGVATAEGVEPQWTDPMGRDIPIRNVTIDGAPYRMEFTQFNWSDCTCETRLIRDNADKAVVIPKGTEVEIEVAKISKTNYCDIYFMGFNGGYSSDEELVAQHKQMIDYRGNDRYLIVARWGNPTTVEALRKAYGDHVLVLVEYCAAGGMEKCGLTPTEQDKDCMQNGILPYPLKLRGDEDKNDVHLSAAGYKVLAHALYELGQKNDLW